MHLSMSRPRRGGTDNPQRFDMFYHSRGGEFYINCLQGITGEFDIYISPLGGEIDIFFSKNVKFPWACSSPHPGA